MTTIRYITDTVTVERDGKFSMTKPVEVVCWACEESIEVPKFSNGDAGVVQFCDDHKDCQVIDR